MVYEIVNMPDLGIRGFTNHHIISGKSGTGKTMNGEFLLENEYLFRKHKCLDLDVSGRFENVSYSLPQSDPRLIEKMGEFPDLVENWQLKPMSFKDEVLLFCGRNIRSYPELPKNFKVVSFDLADLNLDTVKFLLGDTPPLLSTINAFQLKYGLSVSVRDIYDVLFRKEFRGEKTYFAVNKAQRDMIKIRILGWLQTGLFSDAVEKIHFKKMLNDNKTISCLNSILCFSEAEEQLAYAILLGKIIELAMRRQLKHRIYIFIREIFPFLKWTMVKTNLDLILRRGRHVGLAGIDLSCDTQRPIDLPTVLRRQFSYFFQMQGDKMDASKMAEVVYVPPRDINRIPRFSVGQGMLLGSGRYDVPIEAPVCRHFHVDPRTDILSLLKEKYGVRRYDLKKILAFEDIKGLREEQKEVVVDEDEDV